MYCESIIQSSRVENATRAPFASDAVSTLWGHRDAPLGQHARFFLDVTAVSGTTPSMTMNVYAVINGKAVFIGAFPAVTVVGTYTTRVDNVPELVCVAPSPISGTTPSFTCEVRCVR
jgi:hypothetical protein